MDRFELRQKLNDIDKIFKQFSDSEKLMAIKTIMPCLNSTHYHWISNQFIKGNLHSHCPKNCSDVLAPLPLHVLFLIISYLDPISLVQFSQVCKNYYVTCNTDIIWRRLCFRQPWNLNSHDNRKKKVSFSENVSEKGTCKWKQIFIERFRLRRSWLSGKCHIRTFEGHSGGISCVQFDGSHIISGSHDNTIRVWNIKTNSPWSVMTLHGHSGEVRCLALNGKTLVSGSADTTIKVWNFDIQPEWSSIACRVTMVGHTASVRCLVVNFATCSGADEMNVFSGSYDATVKMWCARSGRCKRTLRGHEGPVLCLHLSNQFLLSGSVDKTIKRWCIESGHCLQTLSGHGDSVTCLSLEGNKIISGSLDRTIKLWRNSTTKASYKDDETEILTLDWISSEGHTGVVRCLQADSWRIVSAADDKTIKVWDLASGSRLVTLRSHSDGVTCLQFNDFVIVSGSYDKTVKLWDFTVC